MRRDISGWQTRLTDAMVDRYSRAGLWRGVTIADHAKARAADTPHGIAVVEGGRAVTFTELLREATTLAASLRARGLKPGDVLSFQLPNWIETMTINLAASLGGFVCNPIVPIYRDAEVGYILKNCRSKAIFIPVSFRSIDYAMMIERLRPSLPELEIVVSVRGTAPGHVPFESLLDHAASPQDVERTLDANAVKLVLYTSGTTGNPKGVLHSHNTISTEIDAVTRYWGLTSRDVVLMPSPVTHITGYLYALELGVAVGIKAVLMERWNATDAVTLIRDNGATFSVGATPFLIDLIEAVEQQKVSLPTMRFFATGGAPVPSEVVKRFGRALPDCMTFRVYGSSEAPTVTLGINDRRAQEMGAMTDGQIVNHEVRIADPVTGVTLASGQGGEILTRGPELMLGYTDWQATTEAFDADGFFHTGDLGFISHGDCITISGRKKDLIIRGGENISPKEIEDVLHQHPAVREAAVVAMPHPRLGETPCAFVVLNPGSVLDLAAATRFLDEARIARQKFPERLVIVDQLPRTAAGKILKHVLRARIKEEIAGAQGG